MFMITSSYNNVQAWLVTVTYLLYILHLMCRYFITLATLSHFRATVSKRLTYMIQLRLIGCEILSTQ